MLLRSSSTRLDGSEARACTMPCTRQPIGLAGLLIAWAILLVAPSPGFAAGAPNMCTVGPTAMKAAAGGGTKTNDISCKFSCPLQPDGSRSIIFVEGENIPDNNSTLVATADCGGVKATCFTGGFILDEGPTCNDEKKITAGNKKMPADANNCILRNHNAFDNGTGRITCRTLPNCAKLLPSADPPTTLACQSPPPVPVTSMAGALLGSGVILVLGAMRLRSRGQARVVPHRR